MWENFVFSVNSVLPVFIIIILGYGMKKLKVLDKEIVSKVNTISFYFAIPCLLFRDIYNADFNMVFDMRFVLYAVVSTVLCCLIVWAIAAIFIKDKPTLGAFVQGCFRGNYAIVGLPIVASVLGVASAGKAAMITTFVVPIYNIFAVIVLSLNSGNKKSGSLKSAFLNIVKNPLIIGILCGLPFAIFQIRLPQFVMKSVDYMANLGTPLALICVGASIGFGDLKDTFKLASLVTIIKLIIVPIIFISIAMAIGIHNPEDLVILYVLYATPTAINSYIMASKMGANDKLASSIVIITTLASVFTFTAGIFIFKTLGLI